MVNDLWQHSSVAQALKEEGREEGREEGFVERERKIIQKSLESRFGKLSADVLAALGKADEATLERLITVKSLEDARALLGLQ